MKTGDIILVPFPFSDFSYRKVRPAEVIAITKDKFKDIIVSAISSVVPSKPSVNEIVINPSLQNKLRVASVIKVDRVVTLKRSNVIAQLGKLSEKELTVFKMKFKNLVEDQL